MTQILLLEPDESFRSLLKINIMKAIGCEVIEKKSGVEAISLLEILPSIDLVISREIIGSEKTSLAITNFFESQKYTIPILIIGNKVSLYQKTFALTENQTWQNIILSAGEILGLKVSFDETKHIEEYVPIEIDYFLNITSTSLGCDAFIRVKKGEGYQYIKRLHSTDQFSREDIENYKTKGLKEFFIEKSNEIQFKNFVASQLVLKLEDKKLSSSDRIRTTAEAHQVALDRVNTLGIDGHTVEIIEESMKSMQASITENNSLSNFLQSLRANKFSYAYSHSYFCSLILYQVVDGFDWKSAQVKENVLFVSYFHDISLSENLMRYSSESEVANSNLSKEDQALILNHANRSAAMVDKFPNAPTGVVTILKEHHGSKNGIGIPENLSIAISPISMMFMVVEHFVDEFLKVDGAPKMQDLERIFKVMSAKYNKAAYLQTLVILQNMTLGKNK